MNAQQMFEKLGYTSEIGDRYIVYYEKGNPWTYIKFINKRVVLSTENGLNRKVVEREFIKAIYIQMKELGWL